MPVYFESRKNKRNTNQDQHLYMEYRINHEAMIRLFLIADGMGGLSHGELVSALAVEKWLLKLQRLTLSKEFLGKSLNDQIERLKLFSYSVIQEMNGEIYQELSDKGISGGTTLTTGILFWDTLIVTNCGDSPAYYYQKRDNIFIKLSKDQNAAEELLQEGKVKKGSSEYLKHKHMLTDYIGKYRKSDPHVTTVAYHPGDILLLGSDGAFGRLSEEELKKILTGKTPDQAMKEILYEAERLGEEDNQTLMLYVEEQTEAPAQEKKRGIFRKRQAVK